MAKTFFTGLYPSPKESSEKPLFALLIAQITKNDSTDFSLFPIDL
jgi:hypothetical protein